MLTLGDIADRLRWSGKDRGRRVRRLLRQMERTSGARLIIDLGREARPRYWVDQLTLSATYPELTSDVAPERDRADLLADEVEDMRETILQLTRRVRVLEEKVIASPRL